MATASPVSTSSAPIPITVARTGRSGTSTKPVANVPASAPAVAHALSRPTTVPLAARSPSCSLTTTGVTALRTVAGGSSANSASAIALAVPEPSNASPSARTSGTVSSASSPPPARSSASSGRGGTRSAAWPPAAAPSAMPASTTPMIVV